MPALSKPTLEFLANKVFFSSIRLEARRDCLKRENPKTYRDEDPRIWLELEETFSLLLRHSIAWNQSPPYPPHTFHSALGQLVLINQHLSRLSQGTTDQLEPLPPKDGDVDEDETHVFFAGHWINFGKAHAQRNLFSWILRNPGGHKDAACSDLGWYENNLSANLNALRTNLPGRLKECVETVNIILDGKGHLTAKRQKRT